MTTATAAKAPPLTLEAEPVTTGGGGAEVTVGVAGVLTGTLVAVAILVLGKYDA